MKVEFIGSPNKLVFKFHLEESDIEHPTENFSIGQRHCTIRSDKYDLSNIHPDLLALSAILICGPFVGKELKFSIPPSERFLSEANGILSRYKLATNGSDEVPSQRENVPNSRPGLAFSGGVDSTAAICVMPGSTVPVFMDRPVRDGSLYNPDAAHESCNILAELGFPVERVECDLEYVRSPVGFPTDVANAVPSIILADQLGLESISFGTVLESAYGTGHEHYRDYPQGSHWKFYGTLFSAAGVPMALPIAGVSEVGTAIISYKSPAGMAAQSCIRGHWNEPCMSCWKCFRKGLLGKALGHNELDKEVLRGVLSSTEVRTRLSALPISHENVVSFALHRTGDMDNSDLKTIFERVSGLGSLPFLTKWYTPSIELIPEKWGLQCAEEIQRYLRPMSHRELGIIENWDMDDFLVSESTISARRKLVDRWS
jgi:hypothetical protein